LPLYDLPQNSNNNPKPRKLATVEGVIVDTPLIPHDEKSELTMPMLWHYLMPQYEGRQMLRQPGYIRTGIDGQLFKTSICLPTEKCQFILRTTTLVGIMEELELQLQLKKLIQEPLIDFRKKKALPTIDDLLK